MKYLQVSIVMIVVVEDELSVQCFDVYKLRYVSSQCIPRPFWIALNPEIHGRGPRESGQNETLALVFILVLLDIH